jgi:hypothetical protein
MQNLALEQYIADGRKALKPIWCEKDWKSKTTFVKWFLGNLSALEEIHESRIVSQQNYLAWYLGWYDSNLEYRLIRPTRRNYSLADYSVPTMINQLFFLTEASVAKESLQKPTFEVLPSNVEESGDRLSSRSMKPLLDAVARKNNSEILFQENSRRTKVFGENYIYVGWDKDFATFDDSGNTIIGDVVIRAIEPYYVLYPTRKSWDEVEYVTILWDVLNKEEAEKIYKVSLEKDSTNTVYGFQRPDTPTKTADEVVVYKFFHKPTAYVPNGIVATIIGNKVVEFNTEKYPYDHKQLPLVRRTDIDVPGSVFAESVYRWAVPIQHQINKHYYLNSRAILLASHPKWMMYKGACDIKSLGNAATIVQVKPGMGYPQLAVFNSISQDNLQLLSLYERNLQIVFGIQGVSLGTPPPGSRSKNMLDFYAEEERRRNSTQLIKHNECIRQVFQLAASVVGSYYPVNPERMVRILGNDANWEIRKIGDFRFSSEYEVIVQNSNGFSDSIQGRMEEIEKLLQMFPGSISPQQAFNILQYKIPEKYYDIVTVALKSAQAENEMFLDGNLLQDPDIGEDHLVHLEQHYLLLQTRNYKEDTQLRKEYFEHHIGVHEMVLYDKIQTNPMLGEMVKSKFPYFPVFFRPEPELPPPPPPMPNEDLLKQQEPPPQNGVPQEKMNMINQ